MFLIHQIDILILYSSYSVKTIGFYSQYDIYETIILFLADRKTHFNIIMQHLEFVSMMKLSELEYILNFQDDSLSFISNEVCSAA